MPTQSRKIIRSYPLEQPTNSLLFISVSMIAFLILLVNVSFKIVLWHGLIFSASSFVCPLITGLYLLSLRNCSFKEQRRVLNSSLMAVYFFCIGVYVSVNLPAAEYMNDNKVYQIIFVDIPKKFFAVTLAFALSFYLPHLLFCRDTDEVRPTPKKSVLLALAGGLLFFSLTFYCLFTGPHAHYFQRIFVDSFMVTSLLLLAISVLYLSCVLGRTPQEIVKRPRAGKEAAPIFTYLLCLAVIVMLVSIACEYRMISFGKDHILTASCIFFPIVMIVSTLISEYWGHKAHIKFVIALFLAQLIFEAFLQCVVALPSPRFFNLNPYYDFILMRRLPAASLTILVTFSTNSVLLTYFKNCKWPLPRALRVVIANICASSLLCFVDYSVLLWGIYPNEQVINLVMHVWNYKALTTLLCLPIVLWLCKLLEAGQRQPLAKYAL